MTPSEIEDAARERYNAVSDPHFSSDMIMDVIYQACVELANECNLIENTFQTTSTSGTREYSYPTNAISIRRVEYNGVKLEPASLEQDPKTSTTAPSGTPAQYAIWEDTLILFPTPDTTSDTIKVFAYCEPQAVTSTSTLEVPSRYHASIIDFVLSIMYAKDQNEQMATYHRNLWDKSINRIKRAVAKAKRGDQFAVVRDTTSAPDYPGRIL